MKTVQNTRGESQSCSCTTCVNRSDSDNPPLRRISDLKSRIDRLYFGKYIPHQERKLLHKLVRTRAVYDDIRAQLVSDSTVNLSTKGDFNPKMKGSIRDIDDTEKSSEAVLELVNVVDRGAMGSKKLDDCCSCCSCSSKIKINDRSFKRHRLKRPYAGANEYEARERIRAYRERQKPYNRKHGVRFKTKHIRSDPCTCTFKLLKKHSKAMLKKMHATPPLPLFEIQPTTDEELKRRRISDIARTSYESFIQSNLRLKEKLSDGISKIRESTTRMQEKIELQTKMSLEKLKQAKHKLTSKVKAGAQKIKRSKKKSASQIALENEISFQFIKDSISKLREELNRKQIMKDWECEPECIEDICFPKECFLKLKQKRLYRKNHHHKGINYNIRSQERKAGETLRQTTNKLQTQKLGKAKTIETQRPILREQQTRQYSGIELSFNTPVKEREAKEIHQNGSQVTIKKILHTQAGAHALKRCFCTLKLKAKATKLKMKSVKKKSAKKGKDMRTKSNQENLNLCACWNECEPNTCHPGSCDSNQCIQIIKTREAKRKNASLQTRKTESTSSFTNHPSSLTSNSNRQVMRLGSTLSFNIEFYKGTPNYDEPISRPPMSIIPKQKSHRKVKLKDREIYGNLENVRRNTSTQIFKKNHNARIGTTLKRCFCSLKLQRKEMIKDHINNSFTTGTETIELKPINTANKSTKTKSKYYKPLEPYECEPFTCIPGECDPYVCLERIKRNIRLKEVGLNTARSKTTSSSSSNTYPEKSRRTVQVQYKPRYKERKILVKTKRPKMYSKNIYKHKYPSSAKSGQGFKIGSTLSFNIEFYKNKSPINEIKQMHRTEKVIKVSSSKDGRDDKLIKTNRINVAQVETHVQGPWKRDKGSEGPILKRCFCTLNLNKKSKNQYSKKETFRSQRFISQPTVNRAMIGNTKVTRNIIYGIPVNSHFHKGLIRDQLNTASPRIQNVNNTTAYKRNLPDVEIKSRKSVQINFHTEQNNFKMSQQCKKTLKVNPQKSVERSKNVERIGDIKHFYTSKLQSSHKHQTDLTSLTRCLRRCFYTMNLKVENKRNYKGHEFSKKGKRGLYKLEPYECEPGICIPGECNPYECQKMLAKRLMKGSSIKSGTEDHHLISSASQSMSKYKTLKQQTLMGKSTIPQQVYTKKPKTNSNRVVRIGSCLSFDIEFSKNLSTSPKNLVLPKYPSDITNLGKRVKHYSTSKGTGRGRRQNTRDLQSQSDLIRTSDIGSLTKPTMKRCFCTLKLHKKGRLHKELQNQKPIRPPYDSNQLKTINRGQNTKKIKPLKLTHVLGPYECEPNICIPGECDPYQCLEIIKKRNYNDIGTSPIFQKTHSISNMSTDTYGEKKHKNRAINVKSKKNTNMVTYGKTKLNNEKPTSRAVRISSNISFKIELFKDQALPHHNVQGENKYIRKQSKENKYSRQPLPNVKKHADDYAQTNQNFQHTPSQIEYFARHDSTLTNSIRERCFCTAQFYNSKNKNSPSFFKKCLACLFKKKKPTQDKKINTRETLLKFNPKLNNFMCMPGICVPNECDPYICDEIMRKIRYKNFKTSTADILKSRSVSSNSPYTGKKNAKTSINRKKHVYHTNPKRTENLRINKLNAASWSPDRNFIRIGSKSSFDIEFYKDHPKTIKGNQEPTSLNKQIKRCFCTLKLNELNKKKNSQGNNKLAYECKPHTCIPYQCDPYKCKKRLKLQRHKCLCSRGSPEFGLSTLAEKQTDQSKRSVRIGSTFSFDIEFFKNKNHNGLDLQKLPKDHLYDLNDRSIKPGKKDRKNIINQTQFGNRLMRTQSTMTSLLKPLPADTLQMTEMQYPTQNSFLERCFCTLKLQKANKHPKVLNKTKKKQRQMNTNNKNTATLENIHHLSPFECEPFYCVPGECDPYECKKRIKMRGKKYKTKNINHSEPRSQKGVGIKQISTKSQRNQADFIDTDVPKIVEIPRFTNFNKQPLTIGSNISFSIEFYKKSVPQTELAEPDYDNQIKIVRQKNYDRGQDPLLSLRSRGSEYDISKTLNKSAETENVLKRCFCTLKLNNKKDNMESMIPFHQTVELERVAVHYNNKMLSKAATGVKSLGTKIDKKHIKKSTDIQMPCNIDFCQYGKTMLPNDLKTILPYAPEKFNKTVSKTVLPLQNKYNKPITTMITDRGKRLTHKISNIQTIATKSNNHFGAIKTFISYCAQILYPKRTSKYLPVVENIGNNRSLDKLISSKSKRQAKSNQFVSNSKPKSLQKTSPYYTNHIINLLCQSTQCPGKVRFLNTTMPTNNHLNYVRNKMNVKKLSNLKKKSFEGGTKSDRGVQSSNYCHPCKLKINKDEFYKAAGDQIGKKQKVFRDNVQAKKPLLEMQLDSESHKILNKDQIAHNVTKLNTEYRENPLIEVQLDSKKFDILNKVAVYDKVITSNRKSKINDEKVSIKKNPRIKHKKYGPKNIVEMFNDNMQPKKPLFEMQLDSESNKILNKDQIAHTVTKLNKKYKKKPVIEVQLDSKHLNVLNKEAVLDKVITSNRKSKDCYVKGVIMKIAGKNHEKYCPCGRCICASRKVKQSKQKADKIKNKERANRLKDYSKLDKIRNEKRRKHHKMLEKNIDTNASAGILFAENVLDVGKLGITATTDILRQAGRFARDPKHTDVTKMLQSTCDCPNFIATMRRIRLRCLAMKCMQRLKTKLVGNRDRRTKKKKQEQPQSQRQAPERLDLSCNFYMASLRKRPFLYVYKKMPWFYPHFLSLVNVGKQFIDIILFLLAAVVWSPCILCMELCRACMCCFLCTG